MYCSPVNKEVWDQDHTCFKRPELLQLVEAWNAQHAEDQILGYRSKPKPWLIAALTGRLKGECGTGEGRDVCWVEKLMPSNVPAPIAKAVRAPQPRQWRENPRTWLSNFDIEKVMAQYNEEPSYKYRFLGVFPMDFAAPSAYGGVCVGDAICKMNVKALWKKGVRHVGMITNLDRSDEPGSHWTSSFVCLDPAAPSFGAYYYDSVGRVPPPEIRAWFEGLRDQVMALPCHAGVTACRPFVIDYSKRRHQYANTECGMFAMVYQIRWIEMLRAAAKDAAVTFKDVVNVAISDNDVFELRNILFRTKNDLARPEELTAARRVLAMDGEKRIKKARKA